jgi:hypothetical protein
MNAPEIQAEAARLVDDLNNNKPLDRLRVWALLSALLAGGKDIQLDVAGVPKLPLSVLEKVGLDALNSVKAWADDQGSAPFPEEARTQMEVFLMMAAQRREGVQ